MSIACWVVLPTAASLICASRRSSCDNRQRDGDMHQPPLGLPPTRAWSRLLPDRYVPTLTARGLADVLIDVAPAPCLAGFEGAHDRMLDVVEVLARVTLGGRVTASDMPAG